MRQRSLRFAGWLALDRFSMMMAALLGQLLIARALGPVGTGEINGLLAVIAILTPLAHVGVGWHAAKAIRQNLSEEVEILRSALWWRLLGAAVAGLVAIGIGHFALSATPLTALLALALAQLPLAFSVLEMRYHATLSLDRLVPWKLAVTTLAMVLKLLVALYSPTPTAFLFVIAFETAALGLVCMLAYHRHTQLFIVPSRDRKWTKWFGRRVPVLTIAGIAEFGHLKVDVIMLAVMMGSAQAGLYSVAARVSEVWYVLAVIISASLVPMIWLPRARNSDTTARLQVGFDILYALGVMIAGGLTIFSEAIIHFLFGPEFSAASRILAIHAWAGVFMFLRALLSRWLVENDLPEISLVSHVAALVTNVTLNLLLIPRWGGVGAAMATLISCAVGAWLALFLCPASRAVGRQLGLAILLPLRWPAILRYSRFAMMWIMRLNRGTRS